MSAISGKEAKLKEYIENEMKHNKLISDRVSQVLIPMESMLFPATAKSWRRKEFPSPVMFLWKLT